MSNIEGRFHITLNLRPLDDPQAPSASGNDVFRSVLCSGRGNEYSLQSYLCRHVCGKFTFRIKSYQTLRIRTNTSIISQR